MSAPTKDSLNPSNPRSTPLKRFLGFIRPYRRLLGLAALCGIVRYLIPLSLPWALKILVDDFLLVQGSRPRSQIHLLMLGLCALYAFYGVISYWRSYLAGLVGHSVIFDLRQALYLHVQRMSLSFFDRQKIGGVVSRMTTDIAAAANFVGAAFVDTLMDLASVTVIVAILFLVHPKLALVSLTVLPFYAFVSFHLQKRIREKSRQIQHQLQEISGALHEQFAAIATIQAFTQEETEAREFREQSEQYFDAVMGNVRLQSIALGVTGFLTAVGPIVVLWYGAMQVRSGRLSVGALIAFYGYLAILFQPIQRLTELNLILANSMAAMDRIFEVFDTYPEVQERSGALSLPRVRGDLCFEHVSFRYDGREPVLERVDLRIPAGMTVALIGPSGAGKTTLVKLLLRYYDVTEGRIKLDGFDIRDMTLRSLREQIAVVSQEPILFSGTIADNLRYGRPEADDTAIREAARAAFADRFIDQFPGGYETETGERGVRLSGGQKQRLAIARAFLKDAPILVLDEPTSALDPESEDLVKDALKRLLQKRTALIIAHRLSTLEDADLIVVLENGRIVEQGAHEKLLCRTGSLYRRYAVQQLGTSRNP